MTNEDIMNDDQIAKLQAVCDLCRQHGMLDHEALIQEIIATETEAKNNEAERKRKTTTKK